MAAAGGERASAAGGFRALAAGIATGAAGAVWILATHSRPWYAIPYHVPLAVAAGAWAWQAVFDLRGRDRRRAFLGGTAAGLLVAGRMIQDWPLSGHGVLAGWILAVAPWLWLRLLGGAILVQALVWKIVIDDWPPAVPLGVAAGLALGALLAPGRSTAD